MNPEQPGEAVLDRGWGGEWVFGLIGLIFTLIGPGGYVFSRRAMQRTLRRTEERGFAELVGSPLSKSALAMSAGQQPLELIGEPGFHDRLAKSCNKLSTGLQEIADQAGVPFSSHAVGGMFGIFFTDESPVTYLEQVMACDQDRFRKFFHGMLDAGIYLAPSAFEAGFISSAHSEQDIETTLEAAANVFSKL